jgi:hypothetical protein
MSVHFHPNNPNILTLWYNISSEWNIIYTFVSSWSGKSLEPIDFLIIFTFQVVLMSIDFLVKSKRHPFPALLCLLQTKCKDQKKMHKEHREKIIKCFILNSMHCNIVYNVPIENILHTEEPKMTGGTNKSQQATPYDAGR